MICHVPANRIVQRQVSAPISSCIWESC